MMSCRFGGVFHVWKSKSGKFPVKECSVGRRTWEAHSAQWNMAAPVRRGLCITKTYKQLFILSICPAKGKGL